MKLPSLIIWALFLTACEGSKSAAPQAPAIFSAPTREAPRPAPRGEDALNDGLPPGSSDLGRSLSERQFLQAGREYIDQLNLPRSVSFDTKSDPAQKAKLFVGLRCSSMLRKMRSAPKTFSNLYDEHQLGRLCDAKDIRLVPGRSVSSFEHSGLLFSSDRRSVEVAVRADYTVSGYRVYDINDGLISGLRASEQIVTLDGARRLDSYRSGSRRTIEVTDSVGRLAFSEEEIFMSQTRDGVIRKTLVVRGMRENRTLSIREVTVTPAPGYLGHRKEKTVRCDIQMLNADGSLYAVARESATCF